MKKGIISLKGMKFFAYHGVSKQERIVGNEFEVDVKFEIDLSRAIQTDAVIDTISYADVYMVVAEEMAMASDLLEAVVGRIGARLVHEFPSMLGLVVTLGKRNPPMGGDISSASVIVGYGSMEI